MDVMRVAAFDIETDTTVDGRDPQQTVVVAIALVVMDGPGSVLERFVATGAERDVIATFSDRLDSVEADMFATWNGSGFDLPMLDDRARHCRITLPWKLTASTRPGKYEPLLGHHGTYCAVVAGRRHLDVAYAYQAEARAAGVSWSLKPVARLHGLAPVEVDRTAIHELSADDTIAYVTSDAEVTAELAVRIDAGLWADPMS